MSDGLPLQLHCSSFSDEPVHSRMLDEDEESPLIMNLCGTKIPQVMYSQGRSIWIKFKTSSWGNYKGFSLNVTQVAQPRCKSKS